MARRLVLALLIPLGYGPSYAAHASGPLHHPAERAAAAAPPAAPAAWPQRRHSPTHQSVASRQPAERAKMAAAPQRFALTSRVTPERHLQSDSEPAALQPANDLL